MRFYCKQESAILTRGHYKTLPIKVKDYAAFRKVFDNATPMRTRFGSTSHKVLQSPSEPNEVAVLSDWKNVDQAKVYADSNELKEAMKNAGVISQPDLIFLAEA